MMIDPKLMGKVALITGANHGIDAATALALGTQGVKVFASFFRPRSSALSKRVGSQDNCSMLEAVIKYLNR